MRTVVRDQCRGQSRSLSAGDLELVGGYLPWFPQPCCMMVLEFSPRSYSAPWGGVGWGGLIREFLFYLHFGFYF